MKCASFGTRLEQKLNQVSLQYPNRISESMYLNCVKERFFHGLPKDMRTNLRTQFYSGANYYRLLELARIIESESLHEDSKTEIKSTNVKGKGKVGVATTDNTSQQIQQLQGASCYKVINKIHKHPKFHNMYHNQYKTLYKSLCRMI